jgi:uncharacterized OB-fold protein
MENRVLQERAFNPPTVNAETQVFWDGAKAGSLLYKQCGDCGAPHWYPRALCPFCMSANTSWRSATGAGVVYSFSVARKPDPVPYVIAYVTLDEGMTMMTRIVDCDVDAIHIGQRVRLVFRPTEGGPPVPAFAPA